MLKRFWKQATVTGKFGFVVIMLSIFCSLFAYFIIPDSSNNANNQNSELSLLPPLAKVNILEIKGAGNFSLLHGFKGNYKTIPYQQLVSLSPDGTLQYESIGGQVKVYQDEILRKYKTVEALSSISKTRRYWFGADRYGRDMFSRLILGIRISLLAGFIAVFIATVIGIIVGLFSGYFGGWIDAITMFFINSLWAFPTILFVFAIVMAFGRSLSVIFIAVGCTLWIDVARLVRGQTLKVKEEVFIKAAKSYGASSLRIIFKHILPNILGPLMVLTAANFAIAILIEAGLSYLGFGVSPPIPSLGNMLNENYGFALSGMVFMAIIPALFIMLLVLSFNFLSQSLRDFLEI